MTSTSSDSRLMDIVNHGSREKSGTAKYKRPVLPHLATRYFTSSRITKQLHSKSKLDTLTTNPSPINHTSQIMAVPNSKIPRAAGGPLKNRMPALIGGALLVGAGYYFYTAGGDPKVARKAAERTYHLWSSIRFSAIRY